MNTHTSFAFIVNPTANRLRARKKLDWLRAKSRVYWPDSKIFMSSDKADLRRLAREASRTYDVVVACGGDGTVSEIFNAACDGTAILAVLPMGSGNDFAKAIGMSLDTYKAIEQLRTARPEPVDLVRYEADGHRAVMVNTLGIGLDGLINYRASQSRYLRGVLIYIVAALRSVFSLKPAFFSLNIDSKPVEQQLLMLTVANGAVEGGTFKVAPKANPYDGILDLVAVRPMVRPALLLHLPLFLIGNQHISPRIQFRQARKLEFVTDRPMPMHVDGEQIGLGVSRVSLEVMPGAVQVLRPYAKP